MRRDDHPTRPGISRRELLGGAVGLLGGALAGCGAAGVRGAARAPRGVAPPEPTLPVLEAGGSAFDIGVAVGRRFGAEIRGVLADRASWFGELRATARAQPPSVRETFVAAMRRHAPQALEELRGYAAGSGVGFEDLLVLNLNPEYGALQGRAKAASTGEGRPGCSTIALCEPGRALVAHNEDGDRAYVSRMFMLRGRPQGKPAFICASYPGILPGNAPWINEHGIGMTTNFIATRDVAIGVGRYVLDRLVMEARSFDEALAVCRHPERAYSYHHVLVARGRAVSIEATPSRDVVREIRGLFLHTNHLVHEELAKAAQEEEYVGRSSMTRMRVLLAWRRSLATEIGLRPEDLVRALQSHEGRPYSPCRHPEGEVRGATLLTAFVDPARCVLRVSTGQPCLGRFHDYAM
jgi:hypothetical protein